MRPVNDKISIDVMRTLNFVIELYFRSKTIFVEYQRPIPSVDQGYSGLTTKNVDF